MGSTSLIKGLKGESFSNLYHNSSLYFNVENYLVTFMHDWSKLDANPELTIHYYQNTLNYFTFPTIQNLRELYLNVDTQIFFESTLFQDSVSTYINSNVGTNFTNFSSTLFQGMQSATKPHYDVEELRDIFPQFREDLEMFEVLSYDTDGTLYDALSTPDVKLYYPEPFIASPSFAHEDLWFLNILQYQHWLWFFFISLIMFYFITFINVVRWCNQRTRPKRETRGVSRSKCADLITACVPVSWAISIIVSESVDAADYYDGFGTGEMVVGIRAYQWGWEYFYPKGIDLNYTVSPNYSIFAGNSLKYTTSSSKTLESNTLWKHYQNNQLGQNTNTPSHLILSPNENTNILNFTDFNNLGSNTLQSSNAFKKIQTFSKTNQQDLFIPTTNFNSRYTKLVDLYYNDTSLINSTSYGTFRQHNFLSNMANKNQINSYLDNTGVDKYLKYSSPTQEHDFTTNSLNTTSIFNTLNRSNASPELNLSKLNTLTDSKNFNNPLKYGSVTKGSKLHLPTQSSTNGNEGTHEFEIFNNSLTSTSTHLNNAVTYTFEDLKSGNQSLLPTERTVRLTDKLNPQKNLNTDESTYGSSSLQDIYNTSTTNNSSATSLNRFVSASTTFPLGHAPVLSSNSSQKNLSFDRTFTENSSPALLQSKEESAPNVIFETYWNTYWSHINDKRSNFLLNNTDSMLNSYFPLITEYIEYDFKNWQTLELLEDSYWESAYNSFNHDEYLSVLLNYKTRGTFSSQDTLFNNLSRQFKFKSDKVSSSPLPSTSLPIVTEDFFPSTFYTSLKDFRQFPTEVTADTFDDSYENFKGVNYLLSSDNITSYNLKTPSTTPNSYTHVLDSFRADVDDNSWTRDIFNSSSLSQIDNTSTNVNDTRLSNPLKLRSTAKNSIITYSAIQKVFKSRFDEGRSNARLQDVSNSYTPYMFLSAPKSSYEGMLSKNKDSFFTTNNYNQTLKENINPLHSIHNNMNTYFTNLPFLISTQSDSSRYLWFDWQSRWSSMEVQPSSVARYSLLGVPYTNKSFEYTTQLGDEINDSEAYLTRLARSRKNYMTTWAYTPFLYTRLSSWYQNNENTANLFNTTSVSQLRTLLSTAGTYWSTDNTLSSTTVSTPTHSMYNTPGRSVFQSLGTTTSYDYNVNTLTDLLTKREYLYRSYLRNQGITLYLPSYLTANPTNPLLLEIKKTFPFVEPTAFNSEVSRDFLYQQANFIKFSIVKDLMQVASNYSPITFNNYLFFYCFGDKTPQTIGSNADLFKNQYRPMKKGVTNMIRLHATGAIAMPIEIRLHILASSKDVIHSWSIPSAGIKIDCVPGYSSHRVAIFLVSGTYWGQCMEICGRFHHWMPIILYFMKRDLFFLWCTHFQHFDQSSQNFTAIAKSSSSVSKPVSYTTQDWLSTNI